MHCFHWRNEKYRLLLLAHIWGCSDQLLELIQDGSPTIAHMHGILTKLRHIFGDFGRQVIALRAMYECTELVANRNSVDSSDS
jgi:hypothetical protein